MTSPTSTNFFKHAVDIPPAPACFSQSLCEKVSRTLVVAQRKTAEEKGALLSFLTQFRGIWIEDFGAEEINLPTLNGTMINGLHFPGTQRKALIYLHGNGYFYETAAEKPLKWREGLKHAIDGYPHLVVCNPGGTGKSEGNTHPDTTAREILAQFEYLVRDHSIDPNDIVIAGYSMGGYLGVFGAEIIQQRFPGSKINFLSERSFDSIYSQAAICDLLSIALTEWAKNPIAALESLKGRVCIVYHRLDGVVPYAHSTHSALVKAQRSRTYTCLSLQEENMSQEPSSQAHNRKFTEEEDKKIIVELKKMLNISLTAEEELLSLETL